MDADVVDGRCTLAMDDARCTLDARCRMDADVVDGRCKLAMDDALWAVGYVR
jgi:hypothetical protein